MALSRRAFLCASASGLVTTAAASGCSSRAATTAATSGPVNLTMWTHDQGYIDFFTEALDLAAESTAFDYALDADQVGADDLVTRLIARAVAGRGTPDLAGLEYGNFARMLRGELLTELVHPLDDAVAPYRDDLLDARTAPFSQNGALYALDSDLPLVVYYRRDDIFAAEGIPTEPDSWEDLARFGRRLHQRTGRSLGAVATGADLSQVVQCFWMLLLQRGGGLFDAEGRLLIETPEAEEVLAFLVDGVQSGFIATVSDLYGPSMQRALTEGSIIGFWMATWYKTFGLRPNAPDQKGLWQISALPPFTAGGTRTAVSGGTGFAAITGRSDTQAAADLISTAYLDADQQVRRYQALGYLPTRRSVYEDARLLNHEDTFLGGQKPFAVFSDLVDEAPAAYLSPDMKILETSLSGALVDAYRGRRTPREALSHAADRFRSQVQE